MTTLRILASLALVGCIPGEWYPGDPIEVRVDDRYSARELEEFEYRVARAADLWRDALGPGCRDPFPLFGDGPRLPITMWAPSSWGFEGAIGFAPGDSIEILGPAPGNPIADGMTAVIAHEMGHALGLGHASDRSSIMFPSGGDPDRAPTASDVRRARAALACE